MNCPCCGANLEDRGGGILYHGRKDDCPIQEGPYLTDAMAKYKAIAEHAITRHEGYRRATMYRDADIMLIRRARTCGYDRWHAQSLRFEGRGLTSRSDAQEIDVPGAWTAEKVAQWLRNEMDDAGDDLDVVAEVKR